MAKPGADSNIPGLGPRDGKPIRNPVAEVKAARLSPVEGFVLSRIDGRTSYAEIIAIAGVGDGAAIEILQKLKAMRLIIPADEWAPPAMVGAIEEREVDRKLRREEAEQEKKKAKTPAPVAVDALPSKDREREKKGKRKTPAPKQPTLFELLDDHTSVDPMAVLEGPGLDDDVKMRILRVHRRLAKLDHYQILGLLPGADKKAVKRAYFQASKEFHPDRYFGRDMGPFRHRLQEIFAAATRAFEHLEDDKRREAYEKESKERRAREAARRR